MSDLNLMRKEAAVISDSTMRGLTPAASGFNGPATSVGDRVLCVDLDGTLVSTDLLWESLLSAIRTQPWVLLAVPGWLLRGRPYLKQRLADCSRIDFSTLPYRPDTMTFVAREHRRGRRIVLATASHQTLADGVSRHLGVFSEVIASDGVRNLKGQTKASELVARFGSGNFDYIGDSRADVACWAEATDAITVGFAPANQDGHVRRLEADPAKAKATAKLRAFVKTLRPHQWLKNLLLAVPMLGAHQFDTTTLVSFVAAFASLSLCASGGYVLNDLLDLSADRQHPRKKRRPLASGQLSIQTGVLMIGLTWSLGFGLAAAVLPLPFTLLVATYLFGTAAYSIRFKKEPVLDVLFLAGLYVLRVIGGGLATGVFVSTWLLAFTLFVCLSLAFLKRFIEVRAQAADAPAVAGRGYISDDAMWLQSAGLASAYLSVVIMALYVNNPDVTRLYSQPDRLLLLCPLLLYSTTKIWLNAHRRQIHDDPLVAVATDPSSYVVLALAGLTLMLSI